jgi:hypothetical protein
MVKFRRQCKRVLLNNLLGVGSLDGFADFVVGGRVPGKVSSTGCTIREVPDQLVCACDL